MKDNKNMNYLEMASGDEGEGPREQSPDVDDQDGLSEVDVSLMVETTR